MLDQIKYFAKLSSMAVFSFLKISLLGNLSAALSFITGLILLIYHTGHAAPHASGEANAFILLMAAPVQSVLLLLVLGSAYVLVSFAGGYAVKKVVHRIVSDKAETTLYPLLEKVLSKLQTGSKASGIIKGLDATVVRLQLMDQVKRESENKWIKKALLYGFKKVKLDDVDFSRGDVDAAALIKLKTVQTLQNVATPDKGLFWGIVVFHWVVVVVIWVMGM